MKRLNLNKRYLWAVFCLCLLALCIYALLSPMNAYPTLPAASRYCVINKEAEMPDVAGLHFQLIRTSCDTLAKDTSISLIVSKNRDDEGNVIFKYWPDYRNPVPTIAALPGNRLHIAIPYVVSIYFQARVWQGMNIDYGIGSVLWCCTPRDRPKRPKEGAHPDL